MDQYEFLKKDQEIKLRVTFRSYVKNRKFELARAILLQICPEKERYSLLETILQDPKGDIFVKNFCFTELQDAKLREKYFVELFEYEVLLRKSFDLGYVSREDVLCLDWLFHSEMKKRRIDRVILFSVLFDEEEEVVVVVDESSFSVERCLSLLRNVLFKDIFLGNEFCQLLMRLSGEMKTRIFELYLRFIVDEDVKSCEGMVDMINFLHIESGADLSEDLCALLERCLVKIRDQFSSSSSSFQTKPVFFSRYVNKLYAKRSVEEDQREQLYLRFKRIKKEHFLEYFVHKIVRFLVEHKPNDKEEQDETIFFNKLKSIFRKNKEFTPLKPFIFIILFDTLKHNKTNIHFLHKLYKNFFNNTEDATSSSSSSSSSSAYNIIRHTTDRLEFVLQASHWLTTEILEFCGGAGGDGSLWGNVPLPFRSFLRGGGDVLESMRHSLFWKMSEEGVSLVYLLLPFVNLFCVRGPLYALLGRSGGDAAVLMRCFYVLNHFLNNLSVDVSGFFVGGAAEEAEILLCENLFLLLFIKKKNKKKEFLFEQQPFEFFQRLFDHMQKRLQTINATRKNVQNRKHNLLKHIQHYNKKLTWIQKLHTHTPKAPWIRYLLAHKVFFGIAALKVNQFDLATEILKGVAGGDWPGTIRKERAFVDVKLDYSCDDEDVFFCFCFDVYVRYGVWLLDCGGRMKEERILRFVEQRLDPRGALLGAPASPYLELFVSHLKANERLLGLSPSESSFFSVGIRGRAFESLFSSFSEGKRLCAVNDLSVFDVLVEGLSVRRGSRGSAPLLRGAEGLFSFLLWENVCCCVLVAVSFFVCCVGEEEKEKDEDEDEDEDEDDGGVVGSLRCILERHGDGGGVFSPLLQWMLKREKEEEGKKKKKKKKKKKCEGRLLWERSDEGLLKRIRLDPGRYFEEYVYQIENRKVLQSFLLNTFDFLLGSEEKKKTLPGVVMEEEKEAPEEEKERRARFRAYFYEKVSVEEMMNLCLICKEYSERGTNEEFLSDQYFQQFQIYKEMMRQMPGFTQWIQIHRFLFLSLENLEELITKLNLLHQFHTSKKILHLFFTKHQTYKTQHKTKQKLIQKIETQSILKKLLLLNNNKNENNNNNNNNKDENNKEEENVDTKILHLLVDKKKRTQIDICERLLNEKDLTYRHKAFICQFILTSSKNNNNSKMELFRHSLIGYKIFDNLLLFEHQNDHKDDDNNNNEDEGASGDAEKEKKKKKRFEEQFQHLIHRPDLIIENLILTRQINALKKIFKDTQTNKQIQKFILKKKDDLFLFYGKKALKIQNASKRRRIPSFFEKSSFFSSPSSSSASASLLLFTGNDDEDERLRYSFEFGPFCDLNLAKSLFDFVSKPRFVGLTLLNFIENIKFYASSSLSTKPPHRKEQRIIPSFLGVEKKKRKRRRREQEQEQEGEQEVLSLSFCSDGGNDELKRIEFMEELLNYCQFLFLNDGEGMQHFGYFQSLKERFSIFQLLIYSNGCRPFELSLNVLKDGNRIRQIRDHLTKNDHLKLAMKLCKMADIEIDPILKEWAFCLLKLNQFKSARMKFQEFFQSSPNSLHAGSSPSSSSSMVKQRKERILKQILTILHEKSILFVKPRKNKNKNPSSSAPESPLFQILKQYFFIQQKEDDEEDGEEEDDDEEDELVNPSSFGFFGLYQFHHHHSSSSLMNTEHDSSSNNNGLLQSRESLLNEAKYYLKSYGKEEDFLSFFVQMNEMEIVLSYCLERNVKIQTFKHLILPRLYQTGNLLHFKRLMQKKIDLSSSSLQKYFPYLHEICKFLHKHGNLELLYEFQYFMKDDIRSAYTLVQIFVQKQKNFFLILQKGHADAGTFHATTYQKGMIACLEQAQKHLLIATQQNKVHKKNRPVIFKYLHTIKLQIEILQIPDYSSPLNLFTSNQERTEIVQDLVLLKKTALTLKLMSEYNIKVMTVYQNALLLMIRQKKNTKEINDIFKIMLRNIVLKESQKDDLKLFLIQQYTKIKKPKYAQKLLPQLSNPSKKVKASLMLGDFKGAFRLAVDNHSRTDIQMIKTHCSKIDSKLANSIKDFCVKWLANH